MIPPTRPHSRGVRLAAAALAGALVVLLCGCGSGSDRPEPGDTVPGGDLASVIGAAVEQAGSARVTFDGGGFSASGSMAVGEGGALDQQLTAKAASQTIELVRTGEDSFAKGLAPRSEAEQQAARTKPWLRLTPEYVSGLEGGQAGLVACLDITSPLTLTAALAATTATALQVDDTSQTYQAQITPESLLGDLAASSGVTEPIDLTLVLDSAHRPLGITADLSGQTLRLSYADWGEQVRIDPPAGGQVRED